MRPFKFRARWKDTGKVITKFMVDYVIDALNDPVFIVEQFTGLLDRSGKEIYENDLLDYCGETYLVEWDDVLGGWTAIFKNSALPPMDWKESEIKGNAHQNQGLLECS